MSEHTPGPWELGDWVTSQGKPVYRIIFGAKRKVSSVSVYGHRRDGTSAGRKHTDRYGTERLRRTVSADEAEANARLIAAAPDLLAALQAVDDWLPVSPLRHDEKMICNKVLAALAKATQTPPAQA